MYRGCTHLPGNVDDMVLGNSETQEKKVLVEPKKEIST